MSAREANRKSRKLLPLVKRRKKHGGAPILLKFQQADSRSGVMSNFSGGNAISVDVGQTDQTCTVCV